MAKAKVETTKEFWDNETPIGEFGNDKVRHEVSINELKGKTYVQATKYVQTKTGEKRAKNFTMELENFEQLNDLITDWKMKGAFGKASGNIEAPKREVGLKMQPVMKGKKPTIEERVKANKNFGSLPAGKQELLLDEVSRMDDEYGMVTIGLTKTNFMVEYGRSAADAAARIEKTKGFTRGVAITYLG